MEVKHTILVNQPITTNSQISIDKLKEKLTIALPTISIEDFLQLENLLIDSSEKKETLVNIRDNSIFIIFYSFGLQKNLLISLFYHKCLFSVY